MDDGLTVLSLKREPLSGKTELVRESTKREYWKEKGLINK